MSAQIVPPTPDVTFLAKGLSDVVLHEDDPIVVSVLMMGGNLHRVLIDQGSSVDVMFWYTFVSLQILKKQLQRFNGVLVKFFGEHVEIWGYVELRTTLTDRALVKTIMVRYVVVNAPSSYNLILGQPSLNRLGVIVSSVHMKMKFPIVDGRIVTLKVDQRQARKCYDNSLQNKRGSLV